MGTTPHPIDKAAKCLGLSLEGLGSMLGVTKGAVSQWKLENREIPVEHCVSIMKATANHVTREEMRPDDYWLIWPDLPCPLQAKLADKAVV
jgi:DNA-binding transcriptional regulator YdaS (Cro superfamily)